jgi:outer membrane protein, heavy metal efflux system
MPIQRKRPHSRYDPTASSNLRALALRKLNRPMCCLARPVLAALTVTLSFAALGCQNTGKYRFSSADQESPPATVARLARPEQQAADPPPPVVNPVAFTAPIAETVPAPLPTSEAPPTGVLDVDWLVAEVLSRNPDVRSAAAAWRAAALRYPQEIALDDPMFGTMLGPGSWGDPTVDTAYMVEASQKLPWPGKRRLRGNVAQAEANAAYYDVGEQRLRIAEMARNAFYDYFMAHRQLAVLEKSTTLLTSFRDIAASKYESAEVEQQDVLLADVELAQIERRRLELTSQARVAQARINTLLLLPADAPLAPPPDELALSDTAPTADELRSLALSQRPELAAQQARIRAERYSIALACKDFYPDVEVVGRYDAFWQETPLRPMVGMNLNLPLYKEKRRAAVGEARARLAKEQADLDAKISEIAFEAEQARQQVIESQQSLAVYRERLLPTAEQSIESARASYMAGRLDFLRLIESQRQLLTLQDDYYAGLAEYHQRLAALERVTGALPPQIENRQ